MKILAISDQVMEQLYSPRVKETFAHVNLVVGCGDLPFYYLEYVVSILTRSEKCGKHSRVLGRALLSSMRP